jgi:3-oxoacyl-[acyl-carrier protein] reductase
MLKNKVVLITGGSSGIGAETARLFAENGADVVITYKSNKKGADEVVKSLKNHEVNALAIKADLTKDNNAKMVVKEVIKRFGHIDILVNNAGRYINGDEWNGSAKIWLKSLEQNLISAMSMSKYVTEHFLKQKSGIIINISSRYCADGQFESISYAAAKAGIVNITQAYAKLLAPIGGRVNSVSPNATRAGYWLTAPKEEVEAQGKLVEPIEVAKKVIYLASDEAKNITGQNFFVGE